MCLLILNEWSGARFIVALRPARVHCVRRLRFFHKQAKSAASAAKFQRHLLDCPGFLAYVQLSPLANQFMKECVSFKGLLNYSIH